MSLEASCDHTPTVLPPKVAATSSLPRKSGKNVFSKHLRQVNTQLFRLNGKGAKGVTESELSQVTSLHFDRLVLKLVPRELTKFMQLLTYFTTDPYYDSVDTIVGFTRENYIARRNIHRDDDLATKSPPPEVVGELEESKRFPQATRTPMNEASLFVTDHFT